ncbi:hypothetical protein OFC49_39630, partial [Escherichia coli]|nr:hypothetical protein [Escherichia coli]
RRLLANLAEREARTLVLAAVLLLTAALLPPLDLKRDSWDTVVVFDLTQSMNVEDYDVNGQPVSRLAFAREAAKRALRELPC